MYRFLPKLVEKAKPIYKLLKKIESFLWDETYEQAFLAFKKAIATLPVLNRPRPEVPLLLYFSIVDEFVSSTLVQEEGKHLLLIYFTSHILPDAEKRY